MNRDIIERIRAILKDILNRKTPIPYTERPADFLSPSHYAAFRSLCAEEFEICESLLFTDEDITFHDLTELVEEILTEQ